MKSLRFQKMNIEGSDILSRLQMKKIVGGHGAHCHQTYSHPSGVVIDFVSEYSGSCAQQSAQANSFCVDLLTEMNTSGDSCGYDCSCDGHGS